MTLSDLIKENSLEVLPSSEIVASLNNLIVEKTNSAEIGFRGIVLRYGAPFAATVLAKIDEAGKGNPLLKATYFSITAGGIDFSTPVTIGMILQLQAAGLFTAEEAGKLAALGRWKISLAEANGLPEVTLEQVEAALVEIAAKSLEDTRSQVLANLINECINPGKWATLAELKALIAEWEG